MCEATVLVSERLIFMHKVRKYFINGKEVALIVMPDSQKIKGSRSYSKARNRVDDYLKDPARPSHYF